MINLSSYIDHTLLRPDAGQADFDKLVEEAIYNKFYSVCIPPFWAQSIVVPEQLKLATVSGFPHGNTTPSQKAECAIETFGIDETDIVMNIGKVKDHNWGAVNAEFAWLRNKLKDKIIKYIVEVGYLTDDELFKVADLLIHNKIDFIKTCTGYGPRNVTLEDIVKIKKHVGDNIKIKASGGIKTYEFCKQLIDAGANRIGCSNSVNIIKESLNDGQRTHLDKDTSPY